jgi:hypothetical protein
MDNRQLLVEHDAGSVIINKDNTLISESFIYENTNTSTNKVMYVDCVLQKANTKNRNGRIYPKAILEREMNKYAESIKDGNAVSENGHPDSTVIDLNNIPHRVVKYWWDGDTVMGTLEILTSESYMKTGQGWLPGDKIAEYLKKGVKLGISSRGVGSVQSKGGVDYVQDDFELIGFDLVHSPSTIGAYLLTPKNSMSESKITKSNPLDNVLDKFLD